MTYYGIRTPLLVLLMLAFNFSLFAQRPEGPGNLQNRIDHLIQELELSDLQAEQVTVLMEETHTELEELRNGDTPPDPEAHKAIRQKQDEGLKEILTDAQYERFRAMRKKRGKGPRPQGARRMPPEEIRALKTELKDYKAENIHPVLLEKRLELEAILNADDKSAITGLREQLHEFIEARKAHKRELDSGENSELRKERPMVNRKRGKAAPRGKRHHRFFEQNPDALATAKALAEKYDSDLNRIEEELQPQRAQWREDQKAILEKYLDEDKLARLEQRKQRVHSDKQLKQRIGFLLMDPYQEHKKVVASTGLHEARAFPNPTAGQQTLEFTVHTPGKVKVDLVDGNGKVLENLFKGKLEAGLQSLQIDLPDLKNSIHFYRISGKDGQSLVKVLQIN